MDEKSWNKITHDMHKRQAQVNIRLKKLHGDAIIPTYGSDGAACLDLYGIEDVIIRPGIVRYVRSGWAFGIAAGYEVNIMSRSGLACKKQVIVLNSPSIIDSDYRGEVYIYMKNISMDSVIIYKGNRYAKMSLRKTIHVEFDIVNELDETERGTGGFGSSGK